MNFKQGIIFVLAVCVAPAMAQALFGGTTALSGRLIVKSTVANPTCATATSDGDICAADAIEANGALDVASTSTFTGLITATNGITATNSIYKITQENSDGTCTLGELILDTGGSTKELCYCQATDTLYCAAVNTATGPTD